MDLSMEHKIPLLGVCRGHQFVGHYFGASVKSVDHHKGGRIFLTSDNKSKLLATVEQVYQESSANPQAENSNSSGRYYGSPQAVRKLNDVYCYKSSCLHSQGLFFKGPIDPRVKITARSAEGLPESLQIEDHILTFQHHHEINQDSKIGVASLNIFFDMIKEFHQKKIEQRNAKQAERNEYHKREAHPDDDAAVVSGNKIAKTDRDVTSSSSFTI
jgi:putative glutamine amidotransferase